MSELTIFDRMLISASTQSGQSRSPQKRNFYNECLAVKRNNGENENNSPYSPLIREVTDHFALARRRGRGPLLWFTWLHEWVAIQPHRKFILGLGYVCIYITTVYWPRLPVELYPQEISSTGSGEPRLL